MVDFWCNKQKLAAPVGHSLRKLTAAAVTAWVNLEASRGLKASTLGKQLVMLRFSLQFCHRSGRTGQDLAGVVPHAAAWRLSLVPDPVPAGTVEALFDRLDLRSVKGLRDRAILLLLIGLGLRAFEIAGLRLDDIGWRTGSLRVRGKGDRVDDLPLPDEVGQALEDYVLHGRGGRTAGEEVFWTVIDPVQPLTSNGVCGTIRQICVKAGVTKFGPHRLRETFATSMLASGATLQEVQGLLRHAHRRTTAIYTKVDTNRLIQLVPEWPSAASGRWARWGSCGCVWVAIWRPGGRWGSSSSHRAKRWRRSCPEWRRPASLRTTHARAVGDPNWMERSICRNASLIVRRERTYFMRWLQHYISSVWNLLLWR